MPKLKSKVKLAAHDCEWQHAAGGWTLAAAAAGLTLDNTDAVNYKQAFFAFRTHLPAAATINTATLKVRVNTAGTLGGESVKASAMESFGTPNVVGVPASTVLGSSAAVAIPAGVAAGDFISFNVKTALQAALAAAGYLETGLIIFRVALEGTTAKNGKLSSFTESYAYDAELTLDITWAETETDVYSQIVDRIWDALETHAGFAALVPDGNRIYFNSTTTRDPDKGNDADSDYPEVRVLYSGASPHLHYSTNSCKETVRFEVQIATGDQRIRNRHGPVKWAVYRALANWPELFKGIKWRASELVIINLQAPQIQEGLAISPITKSIRGWAAIWSCEVEFSVATGIL